MSFLARAISDALSPAGAGGPIRRAVGDAPEQEEQVQTSPASDLAPEQTAAEEEKPEEVAPVRAAPAAQKAEHEPEEPDKPDDSDKGEPLRTLRRAAAPEASEEKPESEEPAVQRKAVSLISGRPVADTSSPASASPPPTAPRLRPADKPRPIAQGRALPAAFEPRQSGAREVSSPRAARAISEQPGRELPPGPIAEPTGGDEPGPPLSLPEGLSDAPPPSGVETGGVVVAEHPREIRDNQSAAPAQHRDARFEESRREPRPAGPVIEIGRLEVIVEAPPPAPAPASTPRPPMPGLGGRSVRRI